MRLDAASKTNLAECQRYESYRTDPIAPAPIARTDGIVLMKNPDAPQPPSAVVDDARSLRPREETAEHVRQMALENIGNVSETIDASQARGLSSRWPRPGTATEHTPQAGPWNTI